MAAAITVNALPQQAAFQGARSFVQRFIEVGITLAPNPQSGQPSTFAGSGANNVTLSGSRTSVRIENNGAPTGSQARVTIYGLTQSLLNQLQTLGQNFNEVTQNSITVTAGDNVNGLSGVFSGTIMNAYADYNQAPNVPIILECLAGGINAVVAATASSFKGDTDVATIMAGLARQMSVGFENNGITAKLSNPYFSGNLREQVEKCRLAANINADVIQGVLCIWPKGGSRTSIAGSGPLPLISPETGMIGYPTFWMKNGLIVRALFNPQIAFGGTVQVQSSILQGTGNPNLQRGTFVVWKLDLALDSLVPNGKWEATAHCYALGFAAPIPQPAAPP